MNSVPFISHRLFVAAVEHERRHDAKPRRKQTDQGPSNETVSVELPNGEFNLDCLVDHMTGSPLVRET